MGDWAAHTPVLLQRCLELLGPALAAPARAGRDAIYLDATLGLGGHAAEILARYPRVVLIGLDRDPEALRRAEQRLAVYGDRIHLVHSRFDRLGEVLDRLGELVDGPGETADRLGRHGIDAVLFDLGVSSMQLDEVERGFSYARDTALDMRMDPTSGITAGHVVNTYPAADLSRILRAYGEERFAHRIAAAIVRERERAPITSSARLAELVRAAIPAAARRTGGHPAKRTFQALRIEVNGELEALESGLPEALDRLAPGGRAVVLSYHSLEDRIVKRAMAERARNRAPVDLPVVPPGSGPSLRLLTRGAELPDEAEVAANARSASVRLRAAERLDESTNAQVKALHQPGARGGKARFRDTDPDATGDDNGPTEHDEPEGRNEDEPKGRSERKRKAPTTGEGPIKSATGEGS